MKCKHKKSEGKKFYCELTCKKVGSQYYANVECVNKEPKK